MVLQMYAKGISLKKVLDKRRFIQMKCAEFRFMQEISVFLMAYSAAEIKLAFPALK